MGRFTTPRELPRALRQRHSVQARLDADTQYRLGVLRSRLPKE